MNGLVKSILLIAAVNSVSAYIQCVEKPLTDEGIDEAKEIYQPAVDKVVALKNGDPIVGGTIKTLLEGPDPFISTFKYIYDGVDEDSNEPDDIVHPKRVYDFIIVGAGTAGCALANRLTEVKRFKVLLVEAGDSELFYMDIPLLGYYLQRSPVDWQYKTEPSDRYCTGLKNNECLWPRGKVVGGTSVINQMIYARGNPNDFNNWEAFGNEGWSYDDVLPYFKKVETFYVPTRHNPKFHGYDGYLSVEQTPYKTTPGKAWIKAAQEVGYSKLDYNGKDQSGVSFIQFSMANGTRHSSSRAYLHPIRYRKNLHLSKNSLVTKLIFDTTKTIIVGIIYEKNGTKYKAYARKEVIVSAGAINSPQLLMLSGIGPEKHLNELGIPVEHDLPVGENLMDHVTVSITFLVNNNPNQIDTNTFLQNLPSILYDFARYHHGPLSTTAVEAILFSDTEDKLNITSWPDIELLYAATGFNSFEVFKNNFNYKEELYNELFNEIKGNATFSVFPILLRPKSRGKITLRSRDPRAKPRIDANYFEFKDDMDKVIKGIKMAIEISEQPAMKNVGAKLYTYPSKSCLEVGPAGSDLYWECIVRQFTVTFYHYSGTCKMGPRSDATAVVDSRLRVHNVQGLRVVDASIFPEVPCGHTNSPALMVAEKAADMIKQDWCAPVQGFGEFQSFSTEN